MPPSSRNVCFEINKRITRCEGPRDLCQLIEARAAEFNHVVMAPHTCLSYEHTHMTF
jgi:hypothetical protein